MPARNPILDAWNQMTQESAIETILPCNGSPAWATGLADLRPFTTPEALFAASDSCRKTSKRSLPRLVHPLPPMSCGLVAALPSSWQRGEIINNC